VIKAFNNILAKSLLEKGVPRGTPGRIALSVAGDSLDAKAAVLRLVDDLGFDPVDGGDLDESGRQQPGTPLTAGILKPLLSGARSPRLTGVVSPNTAPSRRLVSGGGYPRYEFRSFHGVARETEVSNTDDAILLPVQENTVPWPSEQIVRIKHEYRRSPVNESRNEMPVVNERVLMNVPLDLPSAPPAKSVHQVEPDIVGKHVADRVEVARVEALNVGSQPRTLRLRQHGRRTVVRLPRQLAKAQATALQGRLDGWNAGAHDVCNFLYRVTEHVSQDHRTALTHWKSHESPKAGFGNLTIVHGVSWFGQPLQVLIGASRVIATAAPQKVQCGVVSDPKQPGSGIGDRRGLGQSLDRLQERLLDHILRINH
jgi:hypothetical protein